MNLCRLLEALFVLDQSDAAHGAQTTLIILAQEIAQDLNRDLDMIALPKGGSA